MTSYWNAYRSAVRVFMNENVLLPQTSFDMIHTLSYLAYWSSNGRQDYSGGSVAYSFDLIWTDAIEWQRGEG